MAGSKGISVASGKTSSSAEMLSSESKEVVSSMGKEVDVCEVSATRLAEFATPSGFTTRESRSGRVMRGPSILVVVNVPLSRIASSPT